ncbi:MAG: WYL domain-containing protein [Gallionella sp.]
MKEQQTERTLWPLGMVGCGDHWTPLAWYELRDECRNFRFDRILCIDFLPAHYPRHPERNLEHYLARVVGANDEQKPV